MLERINISSPHFDKEVILSGISEALDGGQVAQGPKVKQVEELMQSAFDTAYASALINGTASLRAALIAASAVKRGIDKKYIDREMSQAEVIVPAFSFNATLNTVLQSGATARVVDVNLDDFSLDDSTVEPHLNERTIAVMPVDLYGQPSEVSSQNPSYKNIAVVRDAAQAHGATINGQHIVKHGDAVSLSFYPTKNISAPEGGAVLTDDEAIDAVVKVYRNQGMSQRYVYEMMGDNLRMTDIHAAFLEASLRGLERVTKSRRENAALLSERLADIPGLIIPAQLEGRGHVWHQYTVMVNEDEFGMNRDDLSSRLDEKGIGTGVYYPKIMTDHETFKDHPKIISEPTPVATLLSQTVLSLPVHPDLSVDDIDRITQTVTEIQKRH